MDQKMLETVQERVKLLMQEPEILAKMNEFETKEQAQEWIIKTAIATLCVPVNERS